MLSGTRQITKQKVNTVTIDNNTNCYWITNDIVSDSEGENYYKLFENSSIGTTQYYDLKQNEYFIYSINSGKTIVMEGEGTRIKRSWNNGSMSEMLCRTMDTEQILTQGIYAFQGNDYWRTFSQFADATSINSLQVSSTQMQFVSLGEGTKVKIVPVNSSTKYELQINANGIYDDKGDPLTDLHEYKISYKYDSDSSETVLQQLNEKNNSWTASTELMINMSPTVPQVLDYNHNQKLTCYSSLEDQFPIEFSSENDKSIQVRSDRTLKLRGGTKINLADSENKSAKLYQYLFTQQTSNDSNVQVSDEGELLKVTFLKTSSGPSIEKEYTTEKSFLIPEGNYIMELKHKNEDLSNTNIYLLTNVGETIASSTVLDPVNNVGTDISKSGTYYLNFVISDVLRPTVASEIPAEATYKESKDSSEIVGTLVASESTLGKIYFVKYIDNEGKDNSKYWCTKVDAAGTNYSWESGTKLNYKLHLKTTMGESIAVASFIIYAPMMYRNYIGKDSDEQSRIRFSSVLNKVSELDYENKFKYTYQVQNNELISNPLEASSFLLEIHPYNKYMISQYDSNSENIQIFNNVR